MKSFISGVEDAVFISYPSSQWLHFPATAFQLVVKRCYCSSASSTPCPKRGGSGVPLRVLSRGSGKSVLLCNGRVSWQRSEILCFSWRSKPPGLNSPFHVWHDAEQLSHRSLRLGSILHQHGKPETLGTCQLSGCR